jgi:aspartate racemase
MENKRIIIIGGMGPQASLAFHERLLKASRSHHSGNADKYPEILHLSLQIPEFFGSSKNEGKAIQIINSQLGDIRIKSTDIICMPCNTAHKLIGKINLGPATFVSMLDAVQQELAVLNVHNVGVLASPNSLKSGFYHRVVRSADKTPVVPKLAGATMLNTIIGSVIKGEANNITRQCLTDVAENLVGDGAEVILLGCTELSLVDIKAAVPIIDSLDVLCRAIEQKLL